MKQPVRPYGSVNNKTEVSIWFGLQEARSLAKKLNAALDRDDLVDGETMFSIMLKTEVNSADDGAQISYEIEFDDPIIKIAEGSTDTN